MVLRFKAHSPAYPVISCGWHVGVTPALNGNHHGILGPHVGIGVNMFAGAVMVQPGSRGEAVKPPRMFSGDLQTLPDIAVGVLVRCDEVFRHQQIAVARVL